MLVLHNGNTFNVTDKFTLGQLLKYGATEVVSETEVVTEETTEVVEKRQYKKANK